MKIPIHEDGEIAHFVVVKSSANVAKILKYSRNIMFKNTGSADRQTFKVKYFHMNILIVSFIYCNFLL